MRIAVATDFSDRSREAFRVAAELARKLGGEILVIHHAQATVFPSAANVTGFHDSLEDRLTALVRSEETFRGLQAAPLLIRGGNWHTLAGTLEDRKVDLLVLATHGRSGVFLLLLGSFTERAVRSAPCSTLVCHRRAAGSAPGGDFTMRRLLLAYDFSAGSRAAAALAREWAHAFQSQVLLLHVVDAHCGITGFEVEFFDNWQEFHEKKHEGALEQLQKLAASDWGDLSTEVEVTIGHPVAEILERADRFGADLVVLGKRGLSEFVDAPLGSVAEKVMRKASRPVLLVEER